MNAKHPQSSGVFRPPHCRRTARLHKVVKMAAMLLLALLVTAQARAQSALDGFDPNANGAIQAIVVQPDGKILIGGAFTTLAPNGGPTVTRNRIARLNRDGTLDLAFDANVSSSSHLGVFSIVLQADGKILIGGFFDHVSGQVRNYIARLDPETGVADSFNPNADDLVYTLAVQADGKILVGGHFRNIGGQGRIGIARLDPNTGLADSFNAGADAYVRAIVLQADGKILVGGGFGHIGGQIRTNIARLDPINGLADSFDPQSRPFPGVNNYVSAIAVQADGKIIAAGFFAAIGSQQRNRIARLDPTTGLADSFDPHFVNDNKGAFFATINAVTVQADGKILVGGGFTGLGGEEREGLARLDPATGLADSFNPGGFAAAIAVQPDGKILVGGGFSSIGGQPRNKIARLETDGRADQTLNLNLSIVGGVGGVSATAVQPDGKILIGGFFDTVLGVTRHNIARLNTDGSLDLAFDPNASAPPNQGNVSAITVQPDGKILVGGSFTNIGGQVRNRIARLDPETGAADSFNPNANNSVHTIAVQADGKILVGGSFAGLNCIGGQTRDYLARLDPATGLADSWEPDARGIISAIVVQRDGKILVGGEFNDTFNPITIGGQTRNGIARLDPTTALADSWNPNASYAVAAIAIQPDDKILVGGAFIRVGGQPRNHIARLDPTSGLADSFDPDAGSFADVWSIAVQADGKILAGGRFVAIGGQTRHGIARLNATTGLADSFDPNPSGPDNYVQSIAIQADGKILAGGYFTNIGGQPRNRFARLNNDTAAQQTLAATQTAITWTRGGSSPQFAHVTFETSTDNVNYTALGNGTPVGSNWNLTGLSLPIAENIYLRARGYYRSGQDNSSESIAESVRNVFVFRPSTLGNIATRLRVQAGDNTMIGGFIITGTQPKTVIVRGIGPSLPVPGTLADPVIEVYGASGQLLGTNDNWNDSLTRQQIIDSGLAPTNDLESALWGIINPGAYTVVVRGKNDATGIGLFEVYDLDRTADSKLANIATRGFVETGDNVMIGGTIIVGNIPARVVLRAIGPSLANFGIPNPLSDPSLELHDGNGELIASNDNWRTDQEAEIIATGIPPSNDLESAIVRDLLPGSYTVIVRGVNNSTGVALVEAYGLN